MIKNFIRWHKVQEVPCLCVLAEDATQITAEGVLEMNPPAPQEGAPPPPPQLAPVDLLKSWQKRGAPAIWIGRAFPEENAPGGG